MKIVSKGKLTQDYLKSALNYNAETGEFIWKIREDISPRWNTKFAGKTAGSVYNNGYLHITICNKRHLAHRLAWLYIHGELPKVVDHINGNTLDNRLSNLRSATTAENIRNQKLHKNNTSGVKGVRYHKVARKWLAQIKVNYELKYLGLFSDIEKAKQAYDNAAIKHFGKFARLA